MTDARSTAEKLASFREKYPERHAALQAIVAPLLGYNMLRPSLLKPETLTLICQPVLDKVLCAVYGLEEAE